MKQITNLIVVGISVLVGAGCRDGDPTKTRVGGEKSDSGIAYKFGTKIPNDPNIYTISGTVQKIPLSITTQKSPATGSLSGVMAGGTGFMAGSYYGPELNGKGLIRLTVTKSDCDLAPVGSDIILKTSDTKAILLAPADLATFKCKRQCEPIAPTSEAEEVGVQSYTWELDYARLATPQVTTISSK